VGPGPVCQQAKVRYILALELLERLEQAEKWEKENYVSLNTEPTEETEPPILTFPSLPSLQPLPRMSDNPKDIIFDAFLCDKPVPSLAPINTDRVSLLLKALALSVNAQPLLPEEKSLLTHFIQNKNYPSLQTFIYQKLLHGYLDSPEYYSQLVSFLIDSFPSVEVAAEVIRRLPLLTEELWKYIWAHSHEFLYLLKELVLTCEEGIQGLDEMFGMLDSEEALVQSHATSLISKQLYLVCTEEIEQRAVQQLQQVCFDTLNSHNFEPKICLFFKLLKRNPELLSSLIPIYSQITSPSVKNVILQYFARSFTKNIPQNHPILLEAFENTSHPFTRDAFNIISQLQSIHQDVKNLLINKVQANEHQVLPYLAPHLNMEDIAQLLPSLLGLTEQQRQSYLAKIFDAPDIDACDFLVLVLQFQGSPTQLVQVLKELLDLRHIYPPEVLQRVTEKLVRVEPIPELCMYFILKANELYSQLKVFFISYALPHLLNRKIWDYPRIWKGFVAFVERTVPESLQVLELMPNDIQSKLLEREVIKKGKVEDSLRRQKR